jgi:hypothetical protein
MGLSQGTIWRRIRRAQLPAHDQTTPEGYVWLVDLPAGTTEPVAEISTEIQWLNEEVRHRRELATVLAQQPVARRREVQELLHLLERAHDCVSPRGQGPPRRSRDLMTAQAFHAVNSSARAGCPGGQPGPSCELYAFFTVIRPSAHSCLGRCGLLARIGYIRPRQLAQVLQILTERLQDHHGCPADLAASQLLDSPALR